MTTPVDDRRARVLIRAAHRGRPAARERLGALALPAALARVRALMYPWLVARVPPESLAGQVVAEVLGKLERREIEPGQFEDCLGRTAFRRVHDAARRERRARRLSPLEGDDHPQADPEHGPVTRRDLQGYVRRLVSQLPVVESAIVRLRWWEDLTYAEIGEQLGLSPHRVQAHHAKAVARLERRTAQLA